ncbi:MAG: acyl-CoA dehydrogenase family protein [Saprospiraceae bacterium]|nr:acyl-CoA dehydrogenase family protein [Saprospiraceae bacterium]
MNFEYSDKTKENIKKVKDFMDTHLYPLENEIINYYKNRDTLWTQWPGFEALKEKARSEGLWNLFLPKDYGDLSPGLSNLEYAPLAKEMGKLRFASEVFNCSAPDTGNMEVLAKYGSPEQQEKWLKPLMAGKIRSAFLMTEPDVASSDATNIQTSIRKDGDHYILNGRKWWSSGMMSEHCKIAIVMGKTAPDAPKHMQQSQILVPTDTPGVEIVRHMNVFGYDDSPEGHAEVRLNNVRVPAENLILGEGRGFEIAQGRLGPGRIHHCMRLVGVAERALELMCRRVSERQAFGRPLIKFSSIRQDIAKSRCEIEQARLLTLSAADKMDTAGNKEAKDLIAMIKIIAPNMACAVLDRAIQAHGGMGVSQDTFLAAAYAGSRTLRLADGPDEVHMFQLGRNTVNQVMERAQV